MTYPNFGQFQGFQSLGGEKSDDPQGNPFFPNTPETISGLIGWFDARRPQTIVKDGSNNVSQWDDVRGASFGSLTQGTLSDQPTWIDIGFDGYPNIRFDGISKNISKAAYNVSDYSCFAKLRVLGGSNAIMIGNGHSGLDGFNLMYDVFGSPTRQLLHGAGGTFFDGNYTFNEEVWGAVFDTTSTILNFWVDGVDQGGIPNIINAPTDFFRLGASGANTIPPVNFANCDIQEVVVYNRRLTPAEITQINDYLLRV